MNFVLGTAWPEKVQVTGWQALRIKFDPRGNLMERWRGKISNYQPAWMRTG
jgi:hypothetical protein